jgi:hypothetical protein
LEVNGQNNLQIVSSLQSNHIRTKLGSHNGQLVESYFSELTEVVTCEIAIECGSQGRKVTPASNAQLLLYLGVQLIRIVSPSRLLPVMEVVIRARHTASTTEPSMRHRQSVT